MNVDRLMDAHPLWEDVRALDRQIAFLQGYKPGMKVTRLRNPVPPAALVSPSATSNVNALRRRIAERMAEVKAARLAVLIEQKDELKRIALDGVEADVSKFASSLDAGITGRWAEMAEEYDHRIANLRAAAEAARAQLALLEKMVTDVATTDAKFIRNRETLRQYRGALDVQRVQWLAEADELEHTWNSRVSAIGDDRNARVAAYREARRDSALAAAERRFADLVAALNREVEASRSSLLASLSESGDVRVRQQVGGDGAGLSAPPVPKPLPDAGLEPGLARLQVHRQNLRRTIWLNTRSIVQAAASRRNVRVVFESARGAPDDTLSFRPAVASGGSALTTSPINGDAL